MALGIILSMGVSNVYLNAKQNYNQNEELARMQENGRFALKQIAREVAMAGFYGGRRLDGLDASLAIGTDCTPSPWAVEQDFDPIEFINEYETADGTDHCVGPATGDMVEGADVVAVDLVPATQVLAVQEPA